MLYAIHAFLGIERDDEVIALGRDMVNVVVGDKLEFAGVFVTFGRVGIVDFYRFLFLVNTVEILSVGPCGISGLNEFLLVAFLTLLSLYHEPF